MFCSSMDEVSEGHLACVPNSDPCDPWREGLSLLPTRAGLVRAGLVRSISNQAAGLANKRAQLLPLFHILYRETREGLPDFIL